MAPRRWRIAKSARSNRRFGYARVSTYGQTLDAQLEQLRAEGCSKIYREKVTGAHSDRRELLKMLKGFPDTLEQDGSPAARDPRPNPSLVRTRLSVGGSRIRTLGPSH